MRVLMLNNEYPPLGGGTATVNQAVLERLGAVEGLAIDLITSAAGTEREEERFSERIRITRVPVGTRDLHHASNRELMIYAARALPLAMRRHGETPYQACLAWSGVPAGAIALMLRQVCGLPYLVRVCGPDIPGFEKRYSLISRLLSPLIRAVWRSAETVIAKCKGEADMIRAVDRHVRISLIPNGVNLDEFSPGEPIPDEGPLRLLCVGRLIERKGQRYLIQAVKRLTDERIDVTLDLVGTGDARAAYERQVLDLGLAERIRFLGYVPREDIAAHYAAAHVFVLASHNEGMSVATLEAMAAGLPIVVTRTGGTAELVEDGINGLTFQGGDVEALARHLRSLAIDRCISRCFGTASRARAARFSWNSVVEGYLDLIRDLIGKTPVSQRQKPLDVTP
jgi:glycosyltransferase involved in cell wall biosynthesis